MLTNQEITNAIFIAFYNRAAAGDGLNFWNDKLVGAMGFQELAAGIATHDKFTQLYGNMTNQEFVDTMFINLMGSTGNTGGTGYWVSQLDNGVSRTDLTVSIILGATNWDASQSPELSAAEITNAQNRQQTLLNKLTAAADFEATYTSRANIFTNNLDIDFAYQASKIAVAGINHQAESIQIAIIATKNYLADKGVVVDGYVAGATVFIDRDGDGKQGPSERCPTGITVSKQALSRRDKKIARLYEQGVSKRRIGLYLARWLGWAGVFIAGAAYGLPTINGIDVDDGAAAPVSQRDRTGTAIIQTLNSTDYMRPNFVGNVTATDTAESFGLLMYGHNNMNATSTIWCNNVCVSFASTITNIKLIKVGGGEVTQATGGAYLKTKLTSIDDTIHFNFTAASKNYTFSIVKTGVTKVRFSAVTEVDTTAPRISSIERKTPSTSSTNSDTLIYTVTFDEAVQNVDTTDFSVSGTTATVTNVTNSSGNAYDITVSGGDMGALDGNVTLSLSGTQNITDTSTNALTDTTPTGNNNNSYTLDNTAPAVSTPDLDVGSDTGGSSTDNLTNDTTPTLSGTAEAGSTVKLYSDQEGGGTTVIGTGTATGGNWQITTSALTAQVHSITAKATDTATNESSASSALSVTIDTTAPAVSTLNPADNATNVALSTNLVMTLDGSVLKGTGNIVLYNSSDTAIETFSIATGNGDNGGTATISGAALTINPGSNMALNTDHYVQVANTAIVDSAGNAYAGISDKTSWSFTTVNDTTPPSYENSTPTVTSVGATGGTLNVQLDETGTAYWVVVTDGATAPSVAQVKAGNDSTDSAATKSGNFAISAASTNTTTAITGLTAGTAYDVYVVAKDSANNDQAAVTKVNITTTAAPTVTLAVGSNRIIENAGTSTITATLSAATNEDVVVSLGYTGTATSGGVDYDTPSALITISAGDTTANAATGITSVNDADVVPDETIIIDITGVSGGAVEDGTQQQTIILDETAPSVSTLNPADDATNVSKSTSSLVISFDENIVKGTGNIVVYKASNDSVVETIDVTTASVSVANTDATITLGSSLSYSTAYYVQIDATAFDDAVGYNYAGITDTISWSFTTGSAPAPSAPSAPSTPPVTTSTTDGVTTTSSSTTTGTTTTTVMSVPVVTDTRQEDPNTPNSTLADIPVVTNSAGETIIQVGVPVGVGFTSQTISSSLGATLRDTLVGSTYMSSTSQTAINKIINDGIDHYVPTVANEAEVTVRTITFAKADKIPSVPIVINGAFGTGEDNTQNPNRQEALVIDTSNLPFGTMLNLNNVEFAIVVGAAQVTGGNGRNFMIGDDAVQYVVLGADDDELHGGGGDDIIGSEGGNDLIFGDEGNDKLFGGDNDDTLNGGVGQDRISGGRDIDTVVIDGPSDQYAVEIIYGKTIVTSLVDPNEVDTIINAENLQFTDQTFDITSSESLSWISTLYKQVLGRQADIDGFQNWSAENDIGGKSKGYIAIHFIRSAEYLNNTGVVFDNLTPTEQIEMLYNKLFLRASDAQGLANWLNMYQSGMSIEDIATYFVNSLEMNDYDVKTAGWDFYF